MSAVPKHQQPNIPERISASFARLLPENTPIAIAVSGGADSMALALLVKEWGKVPSPACGGGLGWGNAVSVDSPHPASPRKRGEEQKITALIVDHGVRPESAEEAETVKSWLEASGIQAVILKGAGLEKGAGLQARARDYRYRLLLDWCHANSVDHLLLAHHADDQRETILMRLIRASGVDGLAGMKPVSKREGVSVLRPLLGIPKRDLMCYLKECGQAWMEDPTNHNEAYTRTRLRSLNNALENEEMSPERIELISDNLSRTSDYLAEQTFNFIKGNGGLEEAGYAWVSLPALQAAHEEIRLRALKKMIRFVNGGSLEPRFEELKRLSDNVSPRRRPGSMSKDVKSEGAWVSASAGTTKEFSGATLAHVEFLKKGSRLYAIRELSRMAVREISPGWAGIYDGRYQTEVAVDLPEGQYHIAPLGQGYLALPPEVLKRHEHLPKKLLMTFPALFHLEAPVCVPHMDWSLEERQKNALIIAYLAPEAEENACCDDQGVSSIGSGLWR